MESRSKNIYMGPSYVHSDLVRRQQISPFTHFNLTVPVAPITNRQNLPDPANCHAWKQSPTQNRTLNQLIRPILWECNVNEHSPPLLPSASKDCI
nr:uncharacterized protein LOC118682453 isoform X2 [Bactrocera oleae]